MLEEASRKYWLEWWEFDWFEVLIKFLRHAANRSTSHDWFLQHALNLYTQLAKIMKNPLNMNTYVLSELKKYRFHISSQCTVMILLA